MTTPALSIYDVQCDACREWKHYKEDFVWKGGKRSGKCKECQVKGPVDKEESEPTPTTKNKSVRRKASGKQGLPHRRVKDINLLRNPDPIIAELDRIADNMESPIAWYGQKLALLEWTLSIVSWPENSNHLFVDGCGGSATVILNRPRATAEIYNDRDGMLTNFFRVNRDWPEDLMRRLYLTPWSRDDFMASAGRIIEWRNLEPTERERLLLPLDANPMPSNVEMALTDVDLWGRSISLSSDFFTFINQGHSHKSKHVSWSMEYGAKARKPEWWDKKVGSIEECAGRLAGCAIENTNVLELIEKVNSIDTQVYLDPPYLLETRREGAAQSQYYYEMGYEDHMDMGGLLNNFKGRVAVAGYRSHLYDEIMFRADKGWRCYIKSARAADTKKSGQDLNRIEAIWTNYEPSGYRQLPGFSG